MTLVVLPELAGAVGGAETAGGVAAVAGAAVVALVPGVGPIAPGAGVHAAKRVPPPANPQRTSSSRRFMRGMAVLPVNSASRMSPTLAKLRTRLQSSTGPRL